MRMSRFALLATAPLALAAIVATAPHASAGDISEALTSNGPSLNGIFPTPSAPTALNGTRLNALNPNGLTSTAPNSMPSILTVSASTAL